MLIDCGTTHNFSSTAKVEEFQIPVDKKEVPLVEGNVSCEKFWINIQGNEIIQDLLPFQHESVGLILGNG